MKKNYTLILLLIGSFLFSQNTPLFEKGNTYYNNGDYQAAIDTYEQILQTNFHSSELYFNLANAHYKLNNIAPSIYYYEKALLLYPANQDAQNNLAFAQKMTIDAIDVLPQDQISQSYKSLARNFTYNQWAVGVIVFLWLAFVGFVIYYFSFSSGYKRVFFGVTIVSFVLAVVFLTISFVEFSSYKNEQPAIVFEPVSFRTEPNDRSEILFQLHEGTKVNITETINNWSKVSLSDGNVGWLLTDTVKKVKP